LQPVHGLVVFVHIVFTPNPVREVMLEVEAIGYGADRGCPLYCLVAQPQTMKVLERILLSLSHLDGDEGDDLLRKTVPSAVGSHPLRGLHVAALWESGREVYAGMDEI
jgi:hypothetical protein